MKLLMGNNSIIRCSRENDAFSRDLYTTDLDFCFNELKRRSFIKMYLFWIYKSNPFCGPVNGVYFRLNTNRIDNSGVHCLELQV